MVATGAVAIGMAAIGTTGVATGIIIITMTSSLSVTLAFHGGGVGVRGDILTGITAMGILTTAMVMVVMATDTVTTAMVATEIITAKASLGTGTDPARDQEWPSCNVDSPAPAITMAPWMESWDRKRVGQFALTSAPTDTQTHADPSFSR